MTVTASKFEIGQTYQLPPGTLLLERNIREAKPDKDLIASIKDLGVLEPIGAVLTDDGALLVRSGHRRTLAAIKAKVPTVPVYVRGTDDLDPAAEIHRVISQHDENTHRAGLTSTEQLGVVEQLVAFGVPADVEQLAKRARLDKDQVKAALKVADSKLAAAATERYDLSLDQAAAIVEFEDDKEAVKALVAAAETGKFEHTVQRMRDERDDAEQRAKVLAPLEADGVKILPQAPYSWEKPQALARLIDRETGKDVTLLDHVDCPGHVAWLSKESIYVDDNGNPVSDEVWARAEEAYDDAWTKAEQAGKDPSVDPSALNGHLHPEDLYAERTVYTAVHGCSDPGKYSHRDRQASRTASKPEPTEAEKEKARKERRLVIDNNKAWASARTVRRNWIRDNIVHLKTPPKLAAAFIAAAISLDHGQFSYDWQSNPEDLTREWLGQKKLGRFDLGPVAKNQTENRALVIALLHTLAVYEATRAMENAWRHDGTSNAAGRYLRFLETCGYVLSDVEKYAISKKTV